MMVARRCSLRKLMLIFPVMLLKNIMHGFSTTATSSPKSSMFCMHENLMRRNGLFISSVPISKNPSFISIWWYFRHFSQMLCRNSSEYPSAGRLLWYKYRMPSLFIISRIGCFNILTNLLSFLFDFLFEKFVVCALFFFLLMLSPENDAKTEILILFC